MEPIRIDIPNAKVPPAAYPAADICLAAIREAGMDPWKAARVPIVRECVREWLHGRMDRAGFVRALRNICILNPSLTVETR